MPTTAEARLAFFSTEYATSVDLVKYYDSREFDLVKFASGLTTGVPTIVFGVYELKSATAYGWDFIIFVSVVTAISLIAIFLAMVRIRVYFVYPARQANAIRTYFFELPDPLADQKAPPVNHMYKDTTFNPYKADSAHIMQLVFVCVQAAIFCGVAATGLALKNALAAPVSVAIGTVITGIFTFILFYSGRLYLTGKKDKSADQAVHGVN